MANIMSQVQLSNSVSRNGFDLSKRNLFSAKIGELLPVYCKEVIPGDKFDIDIKALSRTLPINTAAFVRIKEYYDWFFVPTNLLWNKFNTFVTQMGNDVQHAKDFFTPAQISDRHPYMLSDTLYSYLRQMHDGYVANVSATPKNYFGYDRAMLSCKLLEYLGYGNYSRKWTFDKNAPSAGLAENVSLNPFPILAYQKIYSDYFRDSQWEKAHAPSFNIDYMDALQDGNEINPLNYFASSNNYDKYNMLDLRYANWHKDLFTGVLPNSQYGDAATVDLSSLIDFSDTNKFPLFSSAGSANAYYTNYNTGPSGTNLVATESSPNVEFALDKSGVEKIATAMGLTTTKLQNAFSILALRQAEALQRWKEITQSRQQDYKDQIQAHFGVTVSEAYSERCKWLGGDSSVIDINEVVNQNLVSDGKRNIADIAGKGVGSHVSHTSFESQVHGYLMCIYHATPMLDYSLETRISRQNLKSHVTDYAIPELDKTGMVQVPMIEMTNDIELNNGQLIGYAPRYYDYKTEVDEVRGAFRKRDSAWVAPFDDQYLKSLLYAGFSSNQLSPIDYTFFKVNPSILDNLFNRQINQPVIEDGVILSETTDVSVDTDQLMINCYLDVKAVRNLDRNGLPY